MSMKAITIKQPWASLIVAGLKGIENRTWKTNYRGRVLIHAAAKPVKEGWSALNEMQLARVYSYKGKLYGNNEELPSSAIIGSVEIVDCVQNHPSIWAERGVWNWVLANPVMFDEPITGVKGKLSFWDYDGELPREKASVEVEVKKPVVRQRSLKELREAAFMEKVKDGVQQMIDNMTLDEQMKVAFVPLVIEEIAWVYAEKAMVCAARDKVEILKKLSRTLKLVRKKWIDELKRDLDYDHLKNVNVQVEKLLKELDYHFTMLYWSVNREFKRTTPEYPYDELRTYAIISTLFIDMLSEYNLKVDELIAKRLRNDNFEKSVVPPIIKALRDGMIAFAGVEGKFDYNNSDVKLGMDIIGKKIDRIEFEIFNKDDSGR